MIHDIDMMVALLGVSVELLWSACGGGNHHHAAFRDAGGSLVLIESGWLDACIPFEATWRAVFEHAVIVNSPSGVVLYPEGGVAKVLPVEYPVVVSTGINVPPTGWYYEELRSIVDTLEGRCDPASCPDEVVHALRLAEAVGS